MQRRSFVQSVLAASATSAGAASLATAAKADPADGNGNGTDGVAMATAQGSSAALAAASLAWSDDLAYLPATDLREPLRSGALTAVALAQRCLARIDAIDRSGPAIRAVLETDPDLLRHAAVLDAERGRRGPLHGLPVLLKDNIATADALQTTAGSLALVGARAPRDAHLVTRLRKAGALILGKTNMSEWANIRSTRSTSGWSARGGLTRNPHALDRNASGSSSGSAAAVAAGLAPLAIGTETDGSIVSPASVCGIVGFKPTLGMVSRDGIVPIAHSQDTAGAMARTVADAALLWSVIAGPDPRDAATQASAAATAFADRLRPLDPKALRGARLGVVRSHFSGNDRVDPVWEQALDVLRAQGAVLVDNVALSNRDSDGDSELRVLLYELKADLNAYLAEFGNGSAVRTLADVIAFNEAHAAAEMPYFSQELLVRSQALGGLDSAEYRAALASNRQWSRTDGIDAALQQGGFDALVAPTGGAAWLTDYVNGDHFTGSFSTPAAVAGYPHITVPAGFAAGLPLGLSFVGTAWTDHRVLSLAYAYEQGSHAWRPPRFTPSTATTAGPA